MKLNKKTSEDLSPLIGLFILIIIIIYLILAAKGSPEKEDEIKDKLRKKQEALCNILSNINVARAFKEELLKDKRRTTIVLRWMFLGLETLACLVLFFSAGYVPTIQGIVECIVLTNTIILAPAYLYFFLRYGSFVEINKVYQQLQDYVLKLRYDKTEYEIEAYLSVNLESEQVIQKEIEEMELQLKAIEETKLILGELTISCKESEQLQFKA